MGIGGGVVLLLVAVHILLFYLGWKAALDEAARSQDVGALLAGYLVEVKIGWGAWLSLAGSVLWTAAAFVTQPASGRASRRFAAGRPVSPGRSAFRGSRSALGRPRSRLPLRSRRGGRLRR